MAKFKPITSEEINVPGPGFLKPCVYDGAHIEFLAIQKAIQDLPKTAVTDFMREALAQHLGSSKIDVDGPLITEAITMAGYITDPDGRTVPAAMVARSINVGTNLKAPTRFINKAVSASRVPAEAAMVKTAEEILSRQGG